MGEASTNQPNCPQAFIHSVDEDGVCRMIIKHHDLAMWVHSLRYRGWRDVRLVILVREPFASCESYRKTGHHSPTKESAKQHRLRVLWANLDFAVRENIAAEVFTYEGLAGAGARRYLLGFCGLDEAGAGKGLHLPGQAGGTVPFVPFSANAKHYESKLPPHLGGHMGVTHVDEGAAKYLAGLVFKEGAPKCIIDVGCGPGGQVRVFRELVPGAEVTGVDGDAMIDPDIVHDFTKGELPNAGEHDLAWSVEFLEHVEEEFLPNVFALFKKCRFVAITASPPGKPGHHHVNCRDQGYWARKFAENGLALSTELTRDMRSASTMKREFMRETGMLFVNLNL